MNKPELIDAIASGANLSKADAGRALNAMTDAITSAMSSGDGVQLTGFGSFVVRERAARTGRILKQALQLISLHLKLLLSKLVKLLKTRLTVN